MFGFGKSSGKRTHTVRIGENLSDISICYYGTARYALTIWQHNRTIIGNDPNRLTAGLRIVIPHMTVGSYG